MSGINFRATSGYATDGAGETYSLGEAYPTTRGSQTFGWGSNRTGNSRDRAATNAHTSGIVFIANGGSTDTFTVDLPSTGTYDVRLAIGDATNGQAHKIVVKDDTTTLATITGSTSAGQWLDATGTVRTSYLLWESDNVALSLTFATTKLVLTVGDPSGSAATTISHVSYVSSSSGASASGSIDSVDLIAPTGSASSSGNASASGSVDSVDLIAATGTATGTGAGSATGSVDSVDLTAITGFGSSAISFQTPPLKNNTGTVLASISGWTVNVYNQSTGALVVQVTGLSTDSLGRLTVTDAALTSSTTYAYEPVNSTYGRRLPTAAAV